MGAATFRGSLLLLVVGTLLLTWGCLAQDSFFNPDWGFTSYEVVIPRQLVSRRGGPEVAGHMTYLLHVEGRKNIIHLRPKKVLLSRQLRVFTFTEDGIGVEDQPYIPNNCNFRGLVEGVSRSEAMLSTCLGGLRGMLQIEDHVYQIEPIQASYKFEHVLYRLKDDLLTNFTCGLTDEEIERQLKQLSNLPAPRKYSWTDSYIHQKYMEVIIVVDKLRFNFLNANVTRAISDTIVMAGIMDTFFQVLNARVHLQAIEIWTDTSKINVGVKKLIEVLRLFGDYRDHYIYPRIKTDWAHLYVHKYYPDALGWAYVGTVCDSTFGVSTSTLPNVNLVAPSAWSAHELGHGVGMPHDTAQCFCKGKTDCIMSNGGRFGFSNCSFLSYYNHVASRGECLDTVPGIPYKLEKCGNKIVEEGEECDCGTIKECKEDICCQTDCRLKPGAECGTGLCCTKCHFSPSGHICRRKKNECDLPEFCNGTSNLCPNDFYKQDGTPCSWGARCYQKGCHNRYLQCKAVFGSGARNAPFICYLEVNRKTDRFGNCGLEGRTYKHCTSNDLLCGRLQCVNVMNVPEMPDHTTVIFTQVKEFNIRCWGLDYHSSMITMGLPDDGAVKDGTACGKDLMCINRSCRNVSVLHYDCAPEKCNKRAVCNNMKHCHCDYGWAPPFCESPGFGGSIDSGPAGKMKEISKPAKVVPIMFIRLVLLGITLVVVILKEVIGRFLSKKVKAVSRVAKKPLPKRKRKKKKKLRKKGPRRPKSQTS